MTAWFHAQFNAPYVMRTVLSCERGIYTPVTTASIVYWLSRLPHMLRGPGSKPSGTNEYLSPSVWNSLPSLVTNSDSLTTFKSQLKTCFV